MLHIEPKDKSVAEVFSYLLGGVGPRPIALVSTISEDGKNNLSPFSFFNAFGANPPIVAFSASRRVRDNTTKHTFENIIRTKECVIHAVSYNMVQQVSLASTEYAEGVDEFVKSGLTPVDSDIVKAKRVKESPFQMECKLQQMIELGGKHGSGNLAICEVVKFHIDESIFDGKVIHPDRIDLVARMSADYYCRASGENIFEVAKPLTTIGIGYDQLPKFMKESKIYTANNLGQFGNTETILNDEEVNEFKRTIEPLNKSENEFEKFSISGDYKSMLAVAIYHSSETYEKAATMCHQSAKRALDFNDIEFAWKAALIGDSFSK